MLALIEDFSHHIRFSLVKRQYSKKAPARAFFDASAIMRKLSWKINPCLFEICPQPPYTF
jgi:hypothetical protein